MKMNDRCYDCLKWICVIAIPAINTFILTVFPVINIAESATTVTVTIISAFGTLMGALVGISSTQYKKTSTK